MQNNSISIEKMIDMLSSLPTIGKKTARRLTFHILKQDTKYAEDFANAILNLKENVKLCSTCFNYTENDPCEICSSDKRTGNVICVVEDPADVSFIERTNEFRGKYHVLHGLINPLDNITADDIKISELINRLQGIDEVILALNPKIESDITSQYIANMIKPLDVKVSKIASGIPIGTSLEFSDEATLSRALEGRIFV